MRMTSRTGASNPRTAARRPSRRASAFSLLELILVMLVLALAAALSAPTLSRFARGRETADAAAHLLAVIQYAQDRAIATASPHRLYVSAETNSYHIASRRDGAIAPLAEEAGRTFSMPQTVTLTWDAAPETEQRGYIQFDPDGGHDTVIFRVTGRDGEVYTIGCDSPSEPYRIETPDAGGGAR